MKGILKILKKAIVIIGAVEAIIRAVRKEKPKKEKGK